MISYKDMTFCDQQSCKNFGDPAKGFCPRSLTFKVLNDAQKMGLPICRYAFDFKPACYEPGDEAA